jgi:branched-chain amino acid transport system ATP-binding protein
MRSRSHSSPSESLPSKKPPALTLSHIDAGYGPYRALFDVSFSLPAGSIKALLGSNGAGKSTVARAATGLIGITKGTIHVGATDVTGMTTHRIARLGVAHVPEGRGIFSSLTVEENLTLVFRQRAGRNGVNEALARAYDTFPVLKTNRHTRGGNLSGGQQRLQSLASVLIVPPALLIADELSLGLAPFAVDAVYEGLHQIQKAGTALLIVEQQVDRVIELADEAVVLDCGTVAFDGPANEAGGTIDRILASRNERGAPRPAPAQTTLPLDLHSQPFTAATRNGHAHD